MPLPQSMEAAEATLDGLREASKDREKEMLTVVKSLRERQMILKMKRQREAQMSAKADEEIAAETARLDGKLLEYVDEIMEERGALLKYIQFIKDRIGEAREKLAGGYHEDPEVKKAKIDFSRKEHQEGRWADWELPLWRESLAEQGGSVPHPSIMRMMREGPHTRRCEQRVDKEDDLEYQFGVRETDHKKVYAAELDSIEEKKARLVAGKRVIALEHRKIKNLETMIAKEKKDMGREIAELKHRLDLARKRKQQYAEQNSTLSAAHKAKVGQAKAMEVQYQKLQAASPQRAITAGRPAQPVMSAEQWKEFAGKLPSGTTPQETERRAQIWKGMDVNGNGLLSLAEVDKGVRDVLQMEKLFDCKPVLIRAYNRALGDEDKGLLPRRHFRRLLWYLSEYFELYAMFQQVDASGDHRISYEEFESALPRIEGWGASIESPQAAFEQIDKDGGGMILFKEFSDWALDIGLDLQEADAEEGGAEGAANEAEAAAETDGM